MTNLYLFDCFGVVVSDVSTLWMNKRFNAEQTEYARKEVFTKVDDGTMSFDAAMGILANMCGIEKCVVYQEWDDLTYVLTDTVEVLTQLKNQGTVALLSNAASDYLHELFDRLDLNKYFHKLFVSAEMGCAKPHQEIYEKCLASFDEKFDTVYFVDDNPQNLEQPAKLGIKTLQFTTAEKLKKDLGLTVD